MAAKKDKNENPKVEVSYDTDALIQIVKNHTIMNMAYLMAPTPGDAMIVRRTLGVFIKHGVDAETGIKIMLELATVLNPNTKKDEEEETD